MKIQLVALRQCFVWLGAGWYAFKSNLGAWLALSIIFLLLLMLLGMLPFVGIFLIAFIMPFLLTGLLVTAHKSLVGALAQVEDILIGFHDPRFRKPLLVLGGAMVVGAVLLFVSLYPLTGTILQALNMPQSEANVAETLAAMSEGSPVSLMLQGGVMLVVLMAFFFATPLVVFENQEPLDAITTSLLACLKNIIPLVLFAVAILLLALLGSVAFGLGYLVLIPVLAGASYASFRDIFDPADEARPKVPDVA